MNIEIKKCADANDIKGLRYIFVDCLDVDPTFESYKEDYEYCKNIRGLFVGFEEITPLRYNSSEWDEDYWVKLKVDLIKNFSEKRFNHMLEVAKVVKADKVKRLQQERERAKAEKERSVADVNNSIPKASQNTQNVSFDLDKQNRTLEEERRRIDIENQRIQAEIDRKNRERAEKLKHLQEEEERKQERRSPDDSSKKAYGIVVLVVIVVLIAIFMAVIH